MENLGSNLKKMSIDEVAVEAGDDNEMKWGMNLHEVYKLSLKFYKGNFFENFSKKISILCCLLILYP
jgi:hypothetical protein